MKKTELIEEMISRLELMKVYAQQEERGVDGLGNGPGIINGHVVDSKERKNHLKQMEKGMKDPERELSKILKILKCELTAHIVENDY